MEIFHVLSTCTRILCNTLSCGFCSLANRVPGTDLYKCPLSVQNYRFLKITISGHLCGQNRPFVKRWCHHQSVPIPGLQILILLCRTPPCLIQTHQVSDISNTWLRWNLVRLKKKYILVSNEESTLVCWVKVLCMTHHSTPSYPLLSPLLGLCCTLYYVGSASCSDLIFPGMCLYWRDFKAQSEEQLLCLHDRIWRPGLRAGCLLLIHVISILLNNQQTNSLFTFGICNHLLLSMCVRTKPQMLSFYTFLPFQAFQQEMIGKSLSGKGNIAL